MLKNLVEETANNPGTGSTVTLGGAPSGRLTWRGAGFANGAQAFYFITDGVVGEWGIGTVSLSASDTLSRDTVLGNTSGTASRLNFTGTCRVYNALPAERALYVGQSAMTLNGDVSLVKASPALVLDKTASGQIASVQGKRNGSLRWQVVLGDGTAESTGNAGSAFAVWRHNDAGTFVDAPIVISRSTGVVSVGTGGVSSGGPIVTAGAHMRIRSNGTRHLWFEDASGAEKAVVYSDASGLTLRTQSVVGAKALTLGGSGLVMLPPVGSSSAKDEFSSSLHVRNSGGTGDAAVAAMSFECQNAWAVKLHLRNDGYFGLGGWSAQPYRWYVDTATGNMVAAGTVSQNSDPRLKDGVEKIEDALGILDRLDGVRFTWNGASKLVGQPGKRDVGVLADQVEAVLPELVSPSAADPETGERFRTVAYSGLVPVLIEAIKELRSEVAALRAKVGPA